MSSTEIDWQGIGAALVAPFPSEGIEWRPQGKTGAGKRGQLLPYIDARDVQDRLGAVGGCGGWAFALTPIAVEGGATVYGPMGQTAYNVWLEEERRRIPLGDWLQERYGQYQGYCLGCGEHRRRSQCREVRPEGYPLSLAVWVCLTCGEMIDELP